MGIVPTNAIDDILTRPEEMKYFPMVPGIEVALLYSSRETGRWTVLFKCERGSSFSRHKHYAAGEYYVVSGRMEYRVGSAPAGTYGYEPMGVIHEETTFPEDTVLLFTNYGPVLFLDEEGNAGPILDNAFLEDLCEFPSAK